MNHSTVLMILLLPVVTARQDIVMTSHCQDNPRFQFQDVEGYNCGWLAQQAETLCDWELVSPHEPEAPFVPTTIGRVHCPASCGHCEVDTSEVKTDDICYDAKDSRVDVSFMNEVPESRDWVGIYPVLSTTESLEVGSTVHEEPLVWSWLCGVDTDGFPNTASDHHVSANCKAGYNQVVFQDLPPGMYQAVLVRRNDEIFAASQSFFEVMGANAASELCSNVERTSCKDTIRTKEHCYQEGQEFSVVIQNECDILGEDDWFAFFRAEDCSDSDHVCQGEPVIWSMACNAEGCHHVHTEYRYHPHDIVLPAGDYRVALVYDEDDHGEAPYFVRLLSQPMQVHKQGDSCHLTERQS